MKIKTDPKKIKELITRRVDEVIIYEHLRKRMLAGEKLRIKHGIDPTGAILHLGHAVCLLKLREFQELGHQVIFLIGDFTARIGDPTGRIKARPSLSTGQIKKNMRNYQKQASKILDMSKTEVRYNSEWWDKMELKDIMLLGAQVTYSQISARADFKKRLAKGEDFTLEEFMYPVLQAYDSVELKADVEVGGTDQKFNMLLGRRIQKRYNQKPQDVITCPLLMGLDGEKMSKSLGNYVGISEKPNNMFGKIMSIDDKMIPSYFELAARLSQKEIKESLKFEPQEAKARLAQEIVEIYHGKKAAQNAEKEFKRIFKKKKLPSKIPGIKIREKKLNILDLLFKTKLAASKSVAKRLILQKGVKIDGKVQKDWKATIEIKKGLIVQVGKRRFVKLI